jgi:Flp pilus assembly pilin Flp
LRLHRPVASPNAARTKGRKDMLSLAFRFLKSFRQNEDGQDLLEYALLVALIAIVAVTAVTAAGVKVDEIFTQIVDDLP